VDLHPGGYSDIVSSNAFAIALKNEFSPFGNGTAKVSCKTVGMESRVFRHFRFLSAGGPRPFLPSSADIPKFGNVFQEHAYSFSSRKNVSMALASRFLLQRMTLVSLPDRCFHGSRDRTREVPGKLFAQARNAFPFQRQFGNLSRSFRPSGRETAPNRTGAGYKSLFQFGPDV
jgi:hypothetical protein